jgi:hypothetical protein
LRELLPVAVLYDEGGADILDSPGWRIAANIAERAFAA